jgi:hypothetical protein
MTAKIKEVPKELKTAKVEKADKKISIDDEIKQMRLDLSTLKRNMLNGDVQNVRAYKYKRRELARLLLMSIRLKKPTRRKHNGPKTKR